MYLGFKDFSPHHRLMSALQILFRIQEFIEGTSGDAIFFGDVNDLFIMFDAGANFFAVAD